MFDPVTNASGSDSSSDSGLPDCALLGYAISSAVVQACSAGQQQQQQPDQEHPAAEHASSWSESSAFYLNGYATTAIVIVGCVLNVLCICVFLLPRLRHRGAGCMPLVNLYLVAMAVWDIVLLAPGAFLMYSLPTLLYGNVSAAVFGEYSHVLSVVLYTSNMSLTATIWIALALGIDRYVAVNWPLPHKRSVSTRRVLSMLLTVSVAVSVVCVPYLLAFDVQSCLTLDPSTCRPTRLLHVLSVTEFSETVAYRIGFRVLICLLLLQLCPLCFLVLLTLRLTTRLSAASQIRGELMSGASCEFGGGGGTTLANSRLAGHHGSRELSAAGNGGRGRQPTPQPLHLHRNPLAYHLAVAEPSATTSRASSVQSDSVFGFAQFKQRRRSSPGLLTLAQVQQRRRLRPAVLDVHNVILVKFIVCRCCLPILTVLEVIGRDSFDRNHVISFLVQVSNFLIVLNAASNFFVYVCLSGKFRRSLCDLFRCCRCCCAPKLTDKTGGTRRRSRATTESEETPLAWRWRLGLSPSGTQPQPQRHRPRCTSLGAASYRHRRLFHQLTPHPQSAKHRRRDNNTGNGRPTVIE